MNQKPTIQAPLAFNDPEKANGAPQASYGRVARAEGKRYGVLETVIYALLFLCAIFPMWWCVQEWTALPPPLAALLEDRDSRSGTTIWNSRAGTTSDDS